ncbi:MAG: glycosyltransferase family 39 protein [Candidatus Moranbacteria bacterium]|nr:glycosyltransferase family 39 protein [Candidatus Moranbacteria bacterium]
MEDFWDKLIINHNKNIINLTKNKSGQSGFRAKAAFLFLIFAVYVIYFSFGFYHLSEFVTADEHFWVYYRVYQYWHSLSPHEWKNTILSNKPGVTVALISGVALFKENNPFKHILSAKKDMAGSGPDQIKSIFTAFRLPILIFAGIFSLYLFWIIRKLTGNFWISFWSFSLMLLSPILVGISQIVNADALFWLFSTAALLSFLAYLKTEEKKFIIFSPFFLGLSLLTKFVSVVFFPFLFLSIFIFFLFNFPRWEKEKIEIHKKILKISFFYLVTLVGSLLVFSVFMPAVFADRQVFLDYTIGYPGMKKIILTILAALLMLAGDALIFKSRILRKILAGVSSYSEKVFKIVPIFLVVIFAIVIVNWNANQFILNPDKIIDYAAYEQQFFESSRIYERLFYQFYPFVFSLTPLVLISIIFLWIKCVFKKTNNFFLIIILSLFIVVYFLALVAKGLPATIRYSIALYPAASILAAIGIYEFFSLKKLERVKKIWISLVLLGASFIGLWQIRPFYLNYTSDLLPKKYAVTGAWGYGGYEAAQFLNSLPNAENLTAWTDYYGFSNFFKGTTYDNYALAQGANRIDYFILTKQGKIKYDYWCNRRKRICEKRYVPAGQYYEKSNPVWELDIDGRPGNYIKIFKAEN